MRGPDWTTMVKEAQPKTELHLLGAQLEAGWCNTSRVAQVDPGGLR